MQHPDEGTIHAWLDGALDEHEAAQLAEHVATCAECEARVIEARGLIAGASRVLLALDAAPGGVIPTASGGAAATPERDTEREAPARATRHWWRRRGITPALAAAAAVAFVAAGSVLVVRMSEPRTTTELAARVEAAPQPAAAPAVMPPAQPQSGAMAGQLAAPRVAVPTAPNTVAMAPMAADTTRAEPSRGAPASKASAAFGAADRAVAAAPGERAERAPSQIRQNAPATSPAIPSVVATGVSGAAAAPGAMAAKAATRARRSAEPAAAAPAARPEAAMEQRAPAADAPTAPRPSLVASFAGCYRVVSGEGEGMPRAFVLDTTQAAVPGDSAQENGLALVRAHVVRDTSSRASGRWSALGPVARVQWEGMPMVLELRAGTADRFGGTVRHGGRVATVVLERCERR